MFVSLFTLYFYHSFICLVIIYVTSIMFQGMREEQRKAVIACEELPVSVKESDASQLL